MPSHGNAMPRRRPRNRRPATELRVARALTQMREGLSFSAAARRVGTTPRTIKRYAASALRQQASGRYRATKSDRLGRPMRMILEDGLDTVLVRSGRQATLLSRHAHAVHHYLKTGDARPLRAFQGKTITASGQRISFLTDVDVLERLAQVGEVRYEDIYETPT